MPVGLPAPVLLTPGELAQVGEVTISPTRPLVIVVPGRAERWTSGRVDDPTVARFTPGRTDGSATFNPGFAALQVGQTTVSITDPDTGEEISVLLTVPATDYSFFIEKQTDLWNPGENSEHRLGGQRPRHEGPGPEIDHRN